MGLFPQKVVDGLRIVFKLGQEVTYPGTITSLSDKRRFGFEQIFLRVSCIVGKDRESIRRMLLRLFGQSSHKSPKLFGSTLKIRNILRGPSDAESSICGTKS